MWSLRDSALFYLFFKIIKCSKKEKIKEHFKRMIGMTEIKLKRIGSKHETRNQTSCLVFQLLKLFGLKIEKTLIVFSKKSFSLPFLFLSWTKNGRQPEKRTYLFFLTMLVQLFFIFSKNNIILFLLERSIAGDWLVIP